MPNDEYTEVCNIYWEKEDEREVKKVSKNLKMSEGGVQTEQPDLTGSSHCQGQECLW